ncbi:MAG: ATP-binding cassette domain-containing protein, partial [Clostridiales bacterium]|nr:ATP-binding cassette domain-containing protein [Clostridiales bacterium]
MESYSVKNLTFAYPERAVAVLRDLSFSIGEGQFVALCGASGCGKTTLLRQLKPSIAPHGVRSGEILFEGKPLGGVDLRESQKIGFVTQAADNQIVTDKVWHELAFGLESLGMDTPSIRRRVAETASFFGIQTWFHRSVAELSGGQKQILSLASVMAMQPSVLILDEPTAQLDPIAAAEMLDLVGKINRDLGVTVLMTEHRLEEVFPHADRVLVMEDGGVIADGTAREIGAALKSRGHAMFAAMPVPMRVYAASVSSDACPVTVREGRAWLTRQTLTGDCPSPPPYSPPQTTPAVEFDNVWFKYEKSAPDVLKGLSFKAYSGEIHAVLGGNGTGKSTALSLAAGCRKPYRGKVRLSGEELGKIPARRLFDGFLGVLPQNPSSLFVRKTVGEDLLEMLDGTKLSAEEKQARVAEAARICDVSRLTRSHPYDLSGGEQQRAALAKVLLLRPRILLLDEPTKGLDAEFKRKLAGILRDLTARGAAVILVSHDIEFCAEYADRCALFFDGAIVSEADPRAFFAGNGFYTTAANRMARHLLPNAVTANDVIRAVGGTPFTPARDGDGGGEVYADTPEEPLAAGEKLPTRRIYAAVLFAVMLLASLVTAV